MERFRTVWPLAAVSLAIVAGASSSCGGGDTASTIPCSEPAQCEKYGLVCDDLLDVCVSGAGGSSGAAGASASGGDAGASGAGVGGSAAGSGGAGGTSGAGGEAGTAAGGSSAGSGGASAGAGGSGGATSDCNTVVPDPDFAACVDLPDAPSHSGGVIPDGIYRLESWNKTSGCFTALNRLRQSAKILQTAANAYTVEYASVSLDTGEQIRTNAQWSTNGTELMLTYVCGASSSSAYGYSVLDVDGVITLNLSNAGRVWTFERTGD